MSLFNKNKVYVLNRAVHSYDDGCELQPEEVFTSYMTAKKAKEEWLDMVKDMLEDAGIEYEVGDDEIFAGEDSWDAWIETVHVNA
jgi:hypothetical protein